MSTGRSENERVTWVTEATLQTYGDWQSEKVNETSSGEFGEDRGMCNEV